MPSKALSNTDSKENMLSQLFASAGVAVASEDRDPELAAFEVAARILQAETVDDILGETELLKARDILRKPFWLDGFDVRNSDFQDGSGVYMLMSIRLFDDTENRVQVTCGSTNVIAQCVRLQQLDALPAPVCFVEASKPTKSGYYPLWLRKAQVEESL